MGVHIKAIAAAPPTSEAHLHPSLFTFLGAFFSLRLQGDGGGGGGGGGGLYTVDTRGAFSPAGAVGRRRGDGGVGGGRVLGERGFTVDVRFFLMTFLFLTLAFASILHRLCVCVSLTPLLRGPAP